MSVVTRAGLETLSTIALAAALAVGSSCAESYAGDDTDARDGRDAQTDGTGDVRDSTEADATGDDDATGPDAHADADADADADAPPEVPVDVPVEDAAEEEVGPPAYDPWAVPRDCSPGPGTGETCDPAWIDVPSYFYTIVRDAVNGYIAAHPEAFDYSLGYAVAIDPNGYVLAVVADINARGDVCCIQDPNAGDEIVVKRDNVLAENFDILTWDNRPRSGAGIFTGICAPAWF
jgi:hypothetical protein